MNTDTKQFFIYARKSTDDADRQIRSIEDQLAEVRELASRHNLKVVDVLVEKQSAKKPGRPVFNEMIARIEKGEANGILAWHPDRLARNMLDGGRIIHMVDTKAIEDMRFSTFWFEPTPQGKFMLAIAFGQSKYIMSTIFRKTSVAASARNFRTASGRSGRPWATSTTARVAASCRTRSERSMSVRLLNFTPVATARWIA